METNDIGNSADVKIMKNRKGATMFKKSQLLGKPAGAIIQVLIAKCLIYCSEIAPLQYI